MRVAGGFIPRSRSRERVIPSLRDGVKYGLCPRGINAPATLTRPSGAKTTYAIF